MLKINNLFKKFKTKVVLNNVSLAVPEGSVTVLLGGSGVGKSTILRILNNLESLDRGTVVLDGQVLDLTKVNQTHTIGMVFQQFNLFEHLTVLENVTLALINVKKMSKSDADALAINLLSEYGLHDKIGNYPIELSGGQKQRVAIVRALALNPTVVCMDEPTSALDPVLTSFVAKMIQDLASKGKHIIVATHDTSLLDRLNCKIYLMKNGEIIESADSIEFAENKNKFPLLNSFISGNN